MTRILLIILAHWFLSFTLYPQSITVTGESPNYYLKITEVLTNGVKVSQTTSGQLENFFPGDKALIMQMTGVKMGTGSNFLTTLPPIRSSTGNTGNFEILQIDEIVESGTDTIIYFTDNLSNLYDIGEKIQLVKVIEGETITVDGTLTARPWDGQTGGIIAMIGIDTIKLLQGSVIDASGKGFRGGLAPSEIYPEGLCRYGISESIHDTVFFLPDKLYRSGNKGEGIISSSWPYTKGTAYNLNGGGAGNGLFSGGGGGSNFMRGGDGGQQNNSCNMPNTAKGGWGGDNFSVFYDNPLKPRPIFGGGGGTGNTKGGSTPSNGGNGGGMIIMITGTVVTEPNVTIRANGTNAFPESTTGSGAGGGAGGTILMDATNFIGEQFTIEIKGGNGSSTTNPLPNLNGAGGGGSGGVFWHSGSTIPEIHLDTLNGSGGVTPGGSTYSSMLGRPGLQGIKLKGLIVPLTGFLFNSIRGTDTICESQVPNVLTASQPKGGNGTYSYSWEQSTDNENWSPAIGIDELRSFAPMALNQTTFYRRIVNSENPLKPGTVRDTSRVIKIFVYPAIVNNNILGTDTICYNDNGKIITGTPVNGGNNNFSYIWQATTDNQNWSDKGNSSDYDPPVLTSTTIYRRIVNSTAYCSDTSNLIRIAVLPSITNNVFSTPDSTICQGTSPGRIEMKIPEGGSGHYNYLWQYSTSGSWTGFAGTGDSVSFTSGIITETTKFRRIVYSGYNDACIDTSGIKTISARPPISNNFIEGSTVRFTCYDSPVSLSGSVPEDGFGPGMYSYAWQKSTDKILWEDAEGSDRNFTSENLTSTTYFRRKIFSTPLYHECIDTSSSVEVRINPLPTGNVVTTFDTICAGSPVQIKYFVTGSAPFNVSIRGESEPAKSESGVNGIFGYIEFNPVITQEFVMVSLEDDSGCFAATDGFVPLIPVEVYEIPSANAGADAEVCGNVYTLAAQKTNEVYNGFWTAGNVVFSDPTLENAVATSAIHGEQVFKWTETNWQCSDDDEAIITFYEQPEIPEAGADQELDFVFSTQLQAPEPLVGTGSWSVSSGSCEFYDLTLHNTQVSELDNENILKWTVINGVCPAVSDSVRIVVKPIEFKKAFTPDGNGVNDYFHIDAQNAERISARIFNRSGQLVFETDNYCKADAVGSDCDVWKGFNKNNVELPEGTYYYILRMKIAGRQKEFEMRSFVEIIR